MAVTKRPDFSSICQSVKNLPLKIKYLQFRLKIRQITESSRKQQDFRGRQIFSAGLSTETVDSFPLAPARGSLQPAVRIEPSETGLCA
jgi:hypothetical protein